MPSDCYPATYNFIKLSDNVSSPGSNTGYDINTYANGNGVYVVWAGPDPNPEEGETGSEIFVFDGVNTTQIVDYLYDDKAPSINASGQVTWVENLAGGYEVLLYDGTNTTQITNNTSSENRPKINANGLVVWTGYQGPVQWWNLEIFLYDGSSYSNISNRAGQSDNNHEINASGQVVWNGSVPHSVTYNATNEIFLYSPGLRNISKINDYHDWRPKINASGHVVWWGYGGIYYYNGANKTLLPKICITNAYPDINDNSIVVWEGYNGLCSTQEIFIYDGSSTTQLTDDFDAFYDNQRPRISANGIVVWQGNDGTDSEIIVYDGTGNPEPLTSNAVDDEFPLINANGDIVWQRFNGSSYELWLAVRVGDISVSPLALNFGKIDPSSYNEDSVIVENNGSSDLFIYSVSSPNLPFSITSETCSNQTITPTNSCTINVKFDPTQEAAYASIFKITSDNVATPDVIVSLNGKGYIEPCIDTDDDGYGTNGDIACPNGTEIDCNDNNRFVFPGAFEYCDLLDNDCDELIDEDYPQTSYCGVGECESTGQLSCINGELFDTCDPGTPPENPEATCSDIQDNDCDRFTDTKDSNCAITCPNLPTRIEETIVEYSTIQEAYNVAEDGETIQIQIQEITENLNIDVNKLVYLELGYVCNYSINDGNTTIHGDIAISDGVFIIQSGVLEIN